MTDEHEGMAVPVGDMRFDWKHTICMLLLSPLLNETGGAWSTKVLPSLPPLSFLATLAFRTSQQYTSLVSLSQKTVTCAP